MQFLTSLPEAISMPEYFYKSDSPDVCAIVSDWYSQLDALNTARIKLGEVFGADAAPMRDLTSHFVGGIKISSDRGLDTHWKRPDEYGYRSLRQKAVVPKGTAKEARAAIHAEHERLCALWSEHCPGAISKQETWEKLGVNTGNLLLCGGTNFELDGVAYFYLGFEINKTEHFANVAAGKPTAGWIEAATEIRRTEYEAAADIKNNNHKRRS
jgi:hypothetical protein